VALALLDVPLFFAEGAGEDFVPLDEAVSVCGVGGGFGADLGYDAGGLGYLVAGPLDVAWGRCY
jgi:hypothetical protein